MRSPTLCGHDITEKVPSGLVFASIPTFKVRNTCRGVTERQSLPKQCSLFLTRIIHKQQHVVSHAYVGDPDKG